MVSKQTLLDHLPDFNNKWVLLHSDQTVHDIISEVLNAHEDYQNDYDKIAVYFDSYGIDKVADNLYKFCKHNLKYIEEPESEQTVASPGAMLTRGHCDCKGYSNFIGGVLGAMCRDGHKIDWCYRFASYNLFNEIPHHVFIVVKDRGEEIWIDPTPGSSGKKPIWQIDKKLKNIMPLYKISGLDKMGDTAPVTTNTGTTALSSMFNAFATGGDPTQSIIQFAASPQAGQLIKGITSNIKSLVQGVISIFESTQESALVKVYKMFPIATQFPSYVEMDAQINAIRAYVSTQCYLYKQCQSGTGDDQRHACEWVSAYNSIVANYGTLSTWLKVQEAINNYTKDNPIPGVSAFNVNPILIGAGAYLYLTGKKKNQNKKVNGLSESGKRNLLIGGAAVVLLLLLNKKTIPPTTATNMTAISDAVDTTELLTREEYATDLLTNDLLLTSI